MPGEDSWSFSVSTIIFANCALVTMPEGSNLLFPTPSMILFWSIHIICSYAQCDSFTSVNRYLSFAALAVTVMENIRMMHKMSEMILACIFIR